MSAFSVRVHGIPKPQGSKRHVGNGIMVESAGRPLKDWREAVRSTAVDALDGRPPTALPVRLSVTFLMPRPKAHFRTGRLADQLRDDAPWWCAGRPDVDKLLRAVGDALKSAGLYRDDAQVVSMAGIKIYARPDEAPGALIAAEVIEETA